MMLGIDTASNSSAAAVCPVKIQLDPSQEDFLCLAGASSAMIWMADKDGLCTYANPSWLAFCGRALDQETGMGWAESIHPEDALSVLRDYWAALNTRLPLRLEYRIAGNDGAYHAVERLGWPLVGSDGELRGYAGLVTVLDRARMADPDTRRQLACLSMRERQVLELVALGYSTKRVAESLMISYKTADSHRTHLLKKLGLHETASLVRFAIRAGAIGT
jgi:PAS domain S-box-containing protein